MPKTTRCACGASFDAATGGELLEAVERHLEQEHPELRWLGRDPLGELDGRVTELERRLGPVEA